MTKVFFGPDAKPKIFDNIENKKTQTGSYWRIFASTQRFMTVNLPFSFKDWGGIKKGKKIFWVKGEENYNDTQGMIVIQNIRLISNLEEFVISFLMAKVILVDLMIKM